MSWCNSTMQQGTDSELCAIRQTVDMYSDIHNIITFLLTMPVSTALEERSFSCLRHFKTYMRNGTTLNNNMMSLMTETASVSYRFWNRYGESFEGVWCNRVVWCGEVCCSGQPITEQLECRVHFMVLVSASNAFKNKIAHICKVSSSHSVIGSSGITD